MRPAYLPPARVPDGGDGWLAEIAAGATRRGPLRLGGQAPAPESAHGRRGGLVDEAGGRRLSTRITRTDVDGWWTFPVTLDGKAMALGADTSSLMTVISETTAQRAGLSATGDPWFVRSFQGTVAGPMLTVAQMRIGETLIPDVDVVIVPKLPDGLEGMIGTEVLSRVQLKEISGRSWKASAR
jgi:predicted aspartyl protease